MRTADISLIKRLQTELPRGRPFDTAQLAELGISADLAYRYLQSGWIERLARGVYMFKGDELRREDTLCFLAERLRDFHVGGKTALAWQGILHNLPFREVLTLWGAKNSRLPSWFSERFPSRYTVRTLFSDDLPERAGFEPLSDRPNAPPVSVPERALLEMLSEVGVHQGVEEARNIMEMATRLRPKVLSTFLSACRQEKVARLCVAWSGELGLPWAAKARATVGDRFGSSRWVTRLKDGTTLILKP